MERAARCSTLNVSVIVSIAVSLVSGFILPQPSCYELLVKFTDQAEPFDLTESSQLPSRYSPQTKLHESAGAAEVKPLLSAASGSQVDALGEAFGLLRISVVRLDEDVLPDHAMEQYRRSSIVEYVVRNHAYMIGAIEPAADSLESVQWGLQKIRARDGWSVERGNRDVIIGIVDTGVDYLHPDLAQNVWTNSAEDLNNNGKFDPWPSSEGGDLNEQDDDGNGYIDDIVGWDFADAPELPGSGDYTERDNDPMDQGPYSHGTHVAGIACAAADNTIGIAGVAPGCRIMALRAGFGPTGYLQEDDVSSAIVYAVQNGASVINMSWGDTVVSPVIQDVLAYAHAHGCVLVASAGNSSSSLTHYPSGYDQTIAVGNTDSHDRLVGSSNFGPTIDVVAPGDTIWSTTIGGDYGKLSGTSMSAPHVSALAALVKSHHPEFLNEEIRFALHVGAVDLGESGRDDFYGGGRIDVPGSLSLDRSLEVQIELPATDSSISENTPIIGTVAGLLLHDWEVSYSESPPSSAARMIVHNYGTQVIQDTLALWNIEEIPEGEYLLQVRARDANGDKIERATPVRIDRSPPVVSPVSIVPVLEGSNWQFLIEFATDDISLAAVHLRPSGTDEPFQTYPLRYETTKHRWLIGPDNVGTGRWEFYVSSRNRSGLESIEDNSGGYYTVSISAVLDTRLSFVEVIDGLPPGYVVPQATDFDGDGRLEVVIGESVPSEIGLLESTLGQMRIFEVGPSWGIEEVTADEMKMYPLSAGDIDQDGLWEILGTYTATLPSDSSLVFSYYGWEPPSENQFPSRIGWGDSTNTLAVGAADADNDGWGEVYSIAQDIFPHMAIVVKEASANNSFSTIDTLWSPLDNWASFVLRGMTAGDFDGDGDKEVVFCDSEGSFVGFELAGNNRFRSWWTGSSSYGEEACSQALAAADLDGDATTELVSMVRLDEGLNLEHNFDARRWGISAFRHDGTDLSMFWEAALYGVITETGMNGLGVGDLDGDGDEEVVVCAYPDLYAFDYDGGGDSLQVVWYCEGASTVEVLVADLDGSSGGRTGHNELLISFNDRSSIFSSAGFAAGPLPPAFIEAHPISDTEVMIRWSLVSGADSYRVYRGSTEDTLLPIAVLPSAEYLDQGLTTDITYWYAASTIDSSMMPVEGILSSVVSATPNLPPTIIAGWHEEPYHVFLEFSESLDDPSAKEPGHYRLEPGPYVPSSAVLTHGDSGVLLAFESFPEDSGSYVLSVDGVRDRTGVRVRSGESIDILIRRTDSFYLSSVEYLGEGRMALRFNNPPDSLLSTANFAIEPHVNVQEVIRTGDSNEEIELRVDTPSRFDGTLHTLTVNDLKDIYGNELRQGSGSMAVFYFYPDDLSRLVVAPNPAIVDGSPEVVRFLGVPAGAHIRLYDLWGRLVSELTEKEADGVVEWDGRTKHGTEAPAAAYIYHLASSTEERVGKLVIVK
jgi:subtilisin family serine protease